MVKGQYAVILRPVSEESTQTRLGSVLLALAFVLVVGAVGLGLLKYRPYQVLSESMENTLMVGDRLVADTSADGGKGIQRGDVVMLDRRAWPSDPENADIVKRVIGLGGDTVAYSTKSGRLTVDGRPIREDYLHPGVRQAYEDFRVKVPSGDIFVLGDNRSNSVDSRASEGQKRGPVRLSSVRGRVVAVGLPVGRMGTLTPTHAFDSFAPARSTDTMILLVAGLFVGGAVAFVASGIEHLRVAVKRRSASGR